MASVTLVGELYNVGSAMTGLLNKGNAAIRSDGDGNILATTPEEWGGTIILGNTSPYKDKSAACVIT
jgi:hypothetical protein